ncbi:MAG TPA: FAD-dependent oxidoreductase [Lacisediminihabitans sp.]|uniref:FAD-dependent oxidoreductase n=1 Tax=Lacisediminihabitans sp. TaxID=2787631 RepID=UPI002EDB1A3E
MTSLWLDRSAPVDSDPFEDEVEYDLAIAGAGLTGLVTGLLFARAGMRVVILEARAVGAAATGNTTAKLSLLQGSHLSEMLRHTSLATARAYVDGNREGQSWLLRYCEDHDVPVQRRTAFSYASTPGGVERVTEEYRAGLSLGLDVTREASLDVPFPAYGAVALVDQAQFDPMAVLRQLAADFRGHGGRLVQGVRVLRVRPGSPSTVTTTRGAVYAEKVVLATGTPFMDRGLYFAKQEAHRSYALAFRVPGALPDGMYLSVDSPTRSVRTTPVDGEERLLVGGNGHPVGRHPSPLSLVEDLTRWTREYFPGAERTHSWSAQDYRPAGRVPFTGWLPRSRGHVFFASGYDKWGMTNAVASSLTLAADILGGNLPWARKLHRRVTTPADVGSFLGANAAVGVAAVRGYLGAWSTPRPSSAPAEGHGLVSHDRLRPVGLSTADGVSCTVSAMCPHLGGVLAWNDAELSWDCPLHGSRFSAEGRLLDGPATRDLRRLA